MNICVQVFKTNLFFKIFLWLFIAYLGGDKSRPDLADCLPSLLYCLCLCVFVSVPPAPFNCWINTLQDQLSVSFSMRSLLTSCQPLCWQAELSPGSFVPHFLRGTSLWVLLYLMSLPFNLTLKAGATTLSLSDRSITLSTWWLLRWIHVRIFFTTGNPVGKMHSRSQQNV